MKELDFFNEYEINLDDKKKEILQKKDNPVLVYGKAGSGKTTLLLARIAYLIKVENVDASQILNLVFDKAATKYMTGKYHVIYNDDNQTPVFIDFHSFCYRIIKRHDAMQGNETWKAYHDLDKVIKKLIQDMFAKKLTQAETSDLVQKIAYCKNMMLQERDIAKITCDGYDFPAFYKAYEKFKKANRLFDYNDILIQTANIIAENGVLLEEIRQQYQYLNIDEGQELSLLSHMIIKLLSGTAIQFFAVADINQNIAMERCGFQDALVHIEDAYKDTEIIDLNMNYRSNKTIVDIANKFMYKDEEEMISTIDEECDVKFKGFADLTRLYDYAIRKIEEEEDIAFLYHDFAIAIPLIELLRTAEKPFACQTKPAVFFKNDLVKELYDFVSLLHDPRDIDAFLHIHEHFHLNFTNKVLEEIRVHMLNDHDIDVYQAIMESSLRQVSKKMLSSYMEEIRVIAEKSTLEIIDFILDKMKYKAYLSKRNIPLNDPHLLAFKVLASQYEDAGTFVMQLGELSEYVPRTSSSVRISSIIESKGKTFDRVCIMDCVHSIFPGYDISELQMEAQRKLFFQAITRAAKELEFFTFKKAFQTRLEISPFIYEIYGKEMKNEAVAKQPSEKKLKENTLKRGMRIQHTTLGVGKITRIKEGMMEVHFESEVKTLNIKLCIANKLITLL